MRSRALVAALCGASISAASAQPALAQAQAQPDKLPQIYTMTPTGVNLQSGVFIRQKTDLTIGSLSFVRSWQALPGPGEVKTLFGYWSHNFALGAKAEGSRGITIYADGKTYQFLISADGAYWTPHNIDQFNNNAMGAELTGNFNTGFTFRNQNGDKHYISTGLRTTAVDMADGTRLDLGYDGSNRLHTVTSTRGDAIVLDYAGGRIAIACGYNRAEAYVDANTTCAASTLKVSYGYSATSIPLLASVTDLGGAVTSFRYDDYGTNKPNLTCITVPNTQTCEVTNTYGPQAGEDPALTMRNQVRRQVMATGEQWTFFYLNQNLNEMPRQPGQTYHSSAEMTDPLGQPTTAEYENGQIKRLYAPEGLTQYEWNGLWLKSVTLPSGRKTVIGYDKRGNALTTRQVGSGEADLLAATGYPADNSGYAPTGCVAASQKLCSKPTYRVSPNGLTGLSPSVDSNPYRTDYEYDADSGLITKETGPAVNGVRPEKRYTYGWLTAGVRNASNAIVPAASAVRVLLEESQCKTGAAPGCVGTADEVRTRYEYGASGTANALRLRGRVVDYGSGRLNLRTCYAYDTQGNKVSETAPRAGLASCP